MLAAELLLCGVLCFLVSGKEAWLHAWFCVAVAAAPKKGKGGKNWGSRFHP